jgi:hypothetical protein
MAAVFPLCLPACLASQLENDPNPTDPEKKTQSKKHLRSKCHKKFACFPRNERIKNKEIWGRI